MYRIYGYDPHGALPKCESLGFNLHSRIRVKLWLVYHKWHCVKGHCSVQFMTRENESKASSPYWCKYKVFPWWKISLLIYFKLDFLTRAAPVIRKFALPSFQLGLIPTENLSKTSSNEQCRQPCHSFAAAGPWGCIAGFPKAQATLNAGGYVLKEVSRCMQPAWQDKTDCALLYFTWILFASGIRANQTGERGEKEKEYS